MQKLLLASSSLSRQMLLKQARISFELIKQDADESLCYFVGDLKKFVTDVATLKMKHVIMPAGTEGQVVYVLTADTMPLDQQGVCHAKPFDRQDAIDMLNACRSGARVGTAFYLQKRVYLSGQWVMQQEYIGYQEALCVFDVPDYAIDFYLDNVDFLTFSGGVSIEGFGEQFVRKVDGCYSAIIGMPMFELREALYRLGFYS